MFQTPKKYISASLKKRKQVRDINKQLQKGIIPQNLRKSFLLQQVKYALTTTEVNKVLEIADEETFEFLIGKPIAASFDELSNYSEYSFRPEIEKELLWIERFLIDYSDEINQFIQLERQVENAVLLGNYQQAIDLLDGIDDSLTKSLWSIQRRLCIAEFQGGFQENKRVLGAILEHGVGALTGSIASYTSIRIENNISISQYNEILNEYIQKLSPDLRGYYYTKVNFFLDHNEKCAGVLLAMDGAKAGEVDHLEPV